MPNNQNEKFQDHLLEQYKIYVQMADNISSRRDQTNRYYLTIISGLITVLALGNNLFLNEKKWLLLIISLFGILLCILWLININSYKQLNSGKFTVIHEMEDSLPFSPYKREWEIFKTDNNQRSRGKRYLRLTYVEKFIPLVMAVPFSILLIYTVIKYIF